MSLVAHPSPPACADELGNSPGGKPGGACLPRVISLGCRLNLAEGAQIEAMVQGQDLIVINSCSVTNEALRQSRQAVRRAARARPGARLLVTGCGAQTEGPMFAAMPEVDGLVANGAKLDPRAWRAPSPPAPAPAPAPAPRHTRAFVGVQTGCDHACTFCTIPIGRGASRSRPMAEVIRVIGRHLAGGAREVVLTGVDLTSWGHDLPADQRLGHLVQGVLEAFPTLGRLRLSSIDGVEIDPLLFDLIAGEKRVMPHVHLSLQHGADLILKRMRRRHSRAQAVDLVARLRHQRPDIAIGADLIAGFPTETADHHGQNLSIIAELGLVHGHVFPYSPRAATPAARMPQLDPSLIRERAAQMREAVAHIRWQWLVSLLGQPLRVLVEKDGAGYAENLARVAAAPGTPAGRVITITPARIEEGLLR